MGISRLVLSKSYFGAMSKHPIVPGTDFTTIRSLFLKHENRQARSLLATAIEHLKIPAEEADAYLRRLAMAGYLEWHSKYGGSLDWDLSEYGLRLVADGFGPRISRQKAQAIIDEVINRARTINSDPDRIARVKELRLFGSALESDREDFGDVDIEAEIEIRKAPKDEVARAHAKIAAKVPPSWRQHLIRRIFAEEGYDSRNVFSALKKGIKGLSLSQDATKSLGCEFRRIYSFDVEAGNELEPDRATIPRTAPPPKTATEITPFPILLSSRRQTAYLAASPPRR
jgi:predicted nucleotidyltransferase